MTKPLTPEARDYYLTLLPMAWAEDTPKMRRFKRRMARRQPLLYTCLRAIALDAEGFRVPADRVVIQPLPVVSPPAMTSAEVADLVTASMWRARRYPHGGMV